MNLILTPFKFLRLPQFNLPLPSIQKPNQIIVFAFVCFSYFLVTSGLIYDMIVEPPSIGHEQDEITGAYKPVVFMQYRMNGQYIIEGLTAGFLFCIGGLGVVVLDQAHGKTTTSSIRTVIIIAGSLSCFLAYALITVFMRIKLPGYLKSSN
eukprot:TRINITY_DN76_c0_g5_i1.p1 TRINITY_DN76_c0_g5~~TRINITY_DN76_c0_g5_i1.p1  ORF type:complete len:151 (-),score=62.96 TRINITY_DN76_c0_g5_i1:182-634(-)